MLDRRKFLIVGGAGAALAGIGAAALAKVSAGKEYQLINPVQATETGAKIEVLEFFWYGCPHCFDLEPHLNKWVSARLPKDAEFRRLPAIFRDSWVPGARAFYALEATGELSRLHARLFDAIHLEKKVNPGDEKAIVDWVVSMGVDRKKFSDAMASFSVQTKAQRAAQVTRAYKIQGVPAVAVDGRYLTSVAMAGSHETLGGVIEELVALARADRGKK